MSEQRLDVPAALTTLGRRRFVLFMLVVVGTSVAVFLSLLQAPKFVARARVLLPPSPGLDVKGRLLRDIDTEIHIVRSAEIVEAARDRAKLAPDSEVLRRRLRVRAATADILEVSAAAGSAPAAALLANAIADEYTAYANNASSAQAESAIKDLEKHAQGLSAQISDLERRIATTNARVASVGPAEAASAAALLTPLLAEQLDAEARLYSTNTRIGDVRLSAELSRGGARVLERATPPTEPAQPRPVRNGAAGGFLGLLAGAVVALTSNQRDRRLHRRDDIAEVVRAPVLASLEVPRRVRVAVCRALLDKWEPTSRERLVLREAFARLGVTDDVLPANITVVTFAGDQGAALLALKLAAFAASSCARTTLIAASTDPSIAALRIACEEGTHSRPNFSAVRVVLETVTPTGMTLADLTMTLVSARAKDQLVPTWNRPTFVALAVTSGFATAEDLAATAAACLDSGHRIRGVFLANPDPTDRTSGQLDRPWPRSLDADVGIAGGQAHPGATTSVAGGSH